MKQLKFGLNGIKPSDLLARAIRIETMMTGNPVFDDPIPSIAELTAAREELETRITAASRGDRTAIAHRKEQEEVVKTILKKLGNYVQIKSSSTSEILSSGFDVRSKNAPILSLLRPASLHAVRSDKEGVVELNWKPVRGGNQYIVEKSIKDPITDVAEWVHLGYSTRSKFFVKNLEPGVYYWFRVRAIGSAGMSPFSDPATVMAA